jgi:hypothetical protein
VTSVAGQPGDTVSPGADANRMRAHTITASLDPDDGASYNPMNTFCPFLPTLLPADEHR